MGDKKKPKRQYTPKEGEGFLPVNPPLTPDERARWDQIKAQEPEETPDSDKMYFRVHGMDSDRRVTPHGIDVIPTSAVTKFPPGIMTGPNKYQLEEAYLKEKQKLEDSFHDQYPRGIDPAPSAITSPFSNAGYRSTAPSAAQQVDESSRWREAKQKADQLRLRQKYEGGGSGAGGSGSGSGGYDMQPYKGDNYDIEALAQKAAPIHEMGRRLEDIQRAQEWADSQIPMEQGRWVPVGDQDGDEGPRPTAPSDHDGDEGPIPGQESLVEGMPTQASLSQTPPIGAGMSGAQAAHDALVEMQRLNPAQHKTEAAKLNDWLHNYATSLRNPDMVFDPATGELAPGAGFVAPVPQAATTTEERMTAGGAGLPVSRQELAQTLGQQDPAVRARPAQTHSAGGGNGRVPLTAASAPSSSGSQHSYPHLDSLTQKEVVSKPYIPGFDASKHTYGPPAPPHVSRPASQVSSAPPIEYLSPDGRAVPTTQAAGDMANTMAKSGIPQTALETATMVALPELAAGVGRGGKALVGKVANAMETPTKKKVVEGVAMKELSHAPQGVVAREGTVPRVHASAPGAQNIPPAPAVKSRPAQPSVKVNMSRGEAPKPSGEFSTIHQQSGKAPAKPAPKNSEPPPAASKKNPVPKKPPIKSEAKKTEAPANRLRDRKTKGE